MEPQTHSKPQPIEQKRVVGQSEGDLDGKHQKPRHFIARRVRGRSGHWKKQSGSWQMRPLSLAHVARSPLLHPIYSKSPATARKFHDKCVRPLATNTKLQRQDSLDLPGMGRIEQVSWLMRLMAPHNKMRLALSTHSVIGTMADIQSKNWKIPTRSNKGVAKATDMAEAAAQQK